MKIHDRVGLKFTDREAFGSFCVAMAKDSVMFSQAGFLTVIISQKELEQLPTRGESGKLFEKFRAHGMIEVFPLTSTGKRILPTQEEAEKLLRELAETYEKTRSCL